MPRRRQEKRVHRPVVDAARVGQSVPDIAEEAAVVGELLAQDAELLALVLNRGRRDGGNDVARDLLSRYGTLADLAGATPVELAAVPGVGPARAASICAALALGRRADHPPLALGRPIGGSEEIYHHFHGRFGGLKQERFYVLMLDGKGRLARAIADAQHRRPPHAKR